MERINNMARELVTECHETGHPVVVLIADNKTGAVIRSGDGSVSDIINLMAIELAEIVRKTGIHRDDLMDELDNIFDDCLKLLEINNEKD